MRRALYFFTIMVMPAAGGFLAAEPKPDCCFTNSAYSGVCRVTPGADETCKSILEYLNTPNSAGKAYCGGTQIRGGWEEARCAQGAEPKASRTQDRDGVRLDRNSRTGMVQVQACPRLEGVRSP